MRVLTKIAAAAILSVLAAGATHTRFHAQVRQVHDGDTFTVESKGRLIKVRLEGIDCPELGQPFSQVARQRVVTLVLYHDVEVVGTKLDDYGRLVARVLVGGKDVGESLVREGLAWHFVAYSSDPVLASLEKAARASRLGLWRDPNPDPPWEARRNRRMGNANAPDLPLHGNTHSALYHRPGCSQFNCRHCTRVFDSVADASAAGFKPAGCCNRSP